MFIEVKTQTGQAMVNLNNVELIETFTRGGEEYVVFTLLKQGYFHTRENYETIKQRIKNLER